MHWGFWILVSVLAISPFVEYAILRRSDRRTPARVNHPIWLRRAADRLQVMVEIPDRGWVLAIDGPWPGGDCEISHIWEGGDDGRIWRVDPEAQTGPAITVSRPLCELSCEAEIDLIKHFVAHNRQHLPLLCAAIDRLCVPQPTPAKRYFWLLHIDGDHYYVVARDPEAARRTVIYHGIQFGDPSMDLPQAEEAGMITWVELDIAEAEKIYCTIPLADCELGEFLGSDP